MWTPGIHGGTGLLAFRNGVPGLAGRELGPSSRASYNRRVGKTLQDNFPNGVNQRCDSGGGSARSRCGFASLFVMVALGTTINAFQEPYPRPFLVERVLCSWIDSRLHSAGVRIASRPMIRTMFSGGHTRVGMIPVKWSGNGAETIGEVFRGYSFESREKAAASAPTSRGGRCAYSCGPVWHVFCVWRLHGGVLQSLLRFLLGPSPHMCQISSTPHISPFKSLIRLLLISHGCQSAKVGVVAS